MHPISRELSSSTNTLNSLLLNQQNQNLSNNSSNSQMHFEHNNEFLEQILSSSSVPPLSFPSWPGHQVQEQPGLVLASKLNQHQVTNSNNDAKAALMEHQQQQQQLLLSRGFGSGDHINNVVGSSSFKSTNLQLQANDPLVNARFNGYSGSLGQTSNQPSSQFHNHQGGTLPPTNKPAVRASSGGGTGVQPRQRVRARRGQATDPHSIAERLRRERIAERMKGLQELVPNANKTDKATMLDEIIDYVKFLQLQVKVLSVSRLGGAAAIAPLVADEGRSINNGTQTPSSPNNNDGMTVTEQHVVKLMEKDMGSAMQYLQGKGLCLMPVSLANTISKATCHTTRNYLNANGTTNNNPLLIGERVPTSQHMSGLTVQSATIGGPTVEDTLPSKT